MPPIDRPIISFAAEPPQPGVPAGELAKTLEEYFVAACREIHTDEVIGEPGDIHWFPDRTFEGRTYVPATARTSEGYEVFGFVSFLPADDEDPEPTDFEGNADFTGDVAENNPDWKLDINSWGISSWRGANGQDAEIALVWGVPLVAGGEIVTAELANLAVDQCELDQDRFTLVTPDAYAEDYLDVKLWGQNWGQPLAVESLYADGDDEDSDEDASPDPDDAPST
jgi:hypothetical protein